MAMSDDEQTQKLKSFVQRYGSPILIGVLLALCIFFGWQWYQKRHHAQNFNLTAQYQTLLTQAQSVQDKKQYQALLAAGDKIILADPNSVQALQTQLVLAQAAFNQNDLATANKYLSQAQNSKVDDQGLIAVAKLRLAYTQQAQNQLDQALKTLDSIQLEAFIPSVQEAKGDIYVAKNQPDLAKKAYQQAWDVLVKRQQPRELLQMKLANLGVLVETPKIDSPIIAAPSAASEPQPASSPNGES